MTDKPLTEKDIKDFWNEKIDDEYVEWNPLWIELKNVQSAKRLLKSQLHVKDLIDESIIPQRKVMTKQAMLIAFGWLIVEIQSRVDACFQIDDGKEAKE